MELLGVFLSISWLLVEGGYTHMLTLHVKSYVLPTECMCFVWISEQTAIISLYSINLLIFIVAEVACLLWGTSCAFNWQYSSGTCIGGKCRGFCLPDCWLEVSIHPEGPATSHLDRDFLGFPLPSGKCCGGSKNPKSELHASRASPSRFKFMNIEPPCF